MCSLKADKSEATLHRAHQRLRSFPSVPSVNIAFTSVSVINDKYFTWIIIPLQFARNPFFTFQLLGTYAPSLQKTWLDPQQQQWFSPASTILTYSYLAVRHITWHIQNTAAHIVLDSQRPCPDQQLLCHLYWLPLHFCTNYNIATLTSESLAPNQPHQLRTVSSPLGVIWASLTKSAAILN